MTPGFEPQVFELGAKALEYVMREGLVNSGVDERLAMILD